MIDVKKPPKISSIHKIKRLNIQKFIIKMTCYTGFNFFTIKKYNWKINTFYVLLSKLIFLVITKRVVTTFNS